MEATDGNGDAVNSSSRTLIVTVASVGGSPSVALGLGEEEVAEPSAIANFFSKISNFFSNIWDKIVSIF